MEWIKEGQVEIQGLGPLKSAKRLVKRRIRNWLRRRRLDTSGCKIVEFDVFAERLPDDLGVWCTLSVRRGRNRWNGTGTGPSLSIAVDDALSEMVNPTVLLHSPPRILIERQGSCAS